MKQIQLANYKAAHFGCTVSGKVATITLNRPERKNPLTLESYGELRDLFREMVYATDVKAVVFTGEGGNFCSGGDVHDIIGKLVKMDMPELLAFTRMTGDLVKAMRGCPQPIIAAIDGVCTGAGALIACASDLRYAHGAQQARVPVRARRACRRRHGRVHAAAAPDRTVARRRPALSPAASSAARKRSASASTIGSWSRRSCSRKRRRWPVSLADGPTFGHAMTKTMLWQEWSSGLGECIEAEAQAQAICMQTKDFERAYHAFVAKQKPSSRAIDGRQEFPRLAVLR